MSKKSFIFLTCLLLCGNAMARSFPISSDTVAHNAVWTGRLQERIEFLCDTICRGRATGTGGCNEAAWQIMHRFKQVGIIPFGDSYAKHFRVSEQTVGHNIIGMLPGPGRESAGKYLIVCAHYDHLGELGGRLYPGADSNASGVAAMLSLADMFSIMKVIGRKYPQNIIFVAFDAKEMNMAGSAELWRMIAAGELTDPLNGEVIGKKQISLVVNLDQIGSSLAPLKSGREDYLIMLGAHTLKKDELELLHLCNRLYGIDLELSRTYYGSEDFTRIFYGLSDHKIFADNGIPAVFFTSGITLNTFKTYDLPGTLNLPVLRKRILLIYHWIDKIML